MSIKLPKFVELAPERGVLGAFGSTNEDLAFHKRLLTRIDGNLGRVASICSGGEVPLLALLPKAKEVVAVDHAYYALGVTCMKLILLQTIGLKGLKALLEPDYNYGQPAYPKFNSDFHDALTFTWHYLPPELRKQIDQRYFTILRGDHMHMRSCWPSVTQEEADFLVDNCDRLTLCHGDFTDCDGPFDLLYISNMLDHTSTKFDQAPPPVTELIKMLKPGGYILGTTPEIMKRHEPVLKNVSGVEIPWKESIYTKGSFYKSDICALDSKGWTHTLHRLEEAVA